MTRSYNALIEALPAERRQRIEEQAAAELKRLDVSGAERDVVLQAARAIDAGLRSGAFSEMRIVSARSGETVIVRRPTDALRLRRRRDPVAA